MGAVAGEASLTARFDSRQYDNVTPTVTGLRIVDAEDRATSTVRDGASLVFSVADMTRDPEILGVYRAAMEPALVRVWARAHGTSDWLALPVTHLSDDVGDFEELGRNPAGSVFRTDLSSVTSNGGFVDIRIEAADASGNSIELVSAPAFAVPEARRRSVRK
jgi:hypothetical protein